MLFANLFTLKASKVSSTSAGLSSTSKISTDLSIIWVGSIKGKIECRTFVYFRVCPDPSAVTLNDPLHDCQPYTCAFELLNTVQTLEYAEQLVGKLHVEANAIVLDKIGAFTVHYLTACRNLRSFAVTRELERVG